MKSELVGALWFCIYVVTASAGDELPLFDAHIHYNRDVWEEYPPAKALQILEQAGVQQALVSSTPDDGTLKLYESDPRRVVPFLRPYRTQSDLRTWFKDPAILAYVEERLKHNVYRGIGEFHLFSGEVDTPVVRRIVALAVEKNLMLHAHSDEKVVEELFRQQPRAKILWAHAGLTSMPTTVGNMLERYPGLWVELSSRDDIAPDGKLDAGWRGLFLRYPTRFLIGTDTWTASRWRDLPLIAQTTRQWLAQLPREVAENIAYRNAETLFKP
ncbi:MAG TPA: amidohydrolase family protein [Burkholderiales bacterium]|nr:amidohydrolase family protein [Burkholderiales bacterium]